MTELSKHIGQDTDVPAGDIGVGAREVSRAGRRTQSFGSAAQHRMLAPRPCKRQPAIAGCVELLCSCLRSLPCDCLKARHLP